MNHHNIPTLLSDALERNYIQATLSDTQPLSIKRGIVRVAKAIAKLGAAILRSGVRHMTALNEARARDVRFTHSQW